MWVTGYPGTDGVGQAGAICQRRPGFQNLQSVWAERPVGEYSFKGRTYRTREGSGPVTLNMIHFTLTYFDGWMGGLID